MSCASFIAWKKCCWTSLLSLYPLHVLMAIYLLFSLSLFFQCLHRQNVLNKMLWPFITRNTTTQLEARQEDNPKSLPFLRQRWHKILCQKPKHSCSKFLHSSQFPIIFNPKFHKMTTTYHILNNTKNKVKNCDFSL